MKIRWGDKVNNLLTEQELELIDKYFRAANYLSAGQLYLLNNPLLRKPLKITDVKRNVVGHWGTVPGQNFIYVHLNRIINTGRGAQRSPQRNQVEGRQRSRCRKDRLQEEQEEPRGPYEDRPCLL